MKKFLRLLLLLVGMQTSWGLMGQSDSISHFFEDGTYESKHRIGTDMGQLVFGDVNLRYVYLISEYFNIEVGAGVLLGFGRLPIGGDANFDWRWYDRDGGFSLFISPRYRVPTNGAWGRRYGFMRDVHLVLGLVIQHRSSNGVVMNGVSNLDFAETNFMAYSGYEYHLGKAFCFEFGTSFGASSRSGTSLDELQLDAVHAGNIVFDFNFSLKVFYLIK